MLNRKTSPGQSFNRSRMVKKLPKDLDIFSPSTWRKPLCIQTLAKGWPAWADSDWAISFSWCGKTRSMPPPWMSKVSPRSDALMAEHSMCQPGRPLLQGLGHDGSPGLDGFHSTKSIGFFL